MTLKIDRSHACKLSMACLAVAQQFDAEAESPETTPERREICKSSAEMWYSLREEVRAGIAAWDEKHAK